MPITVLWNTKQYSTQIREQEFLAAPYLDLALLHVDELLECPCVYLDLDDDVQLGDELYSYGYVEWHEAGAPALFRYEGRADGADLLLQLKEGQGRPGLSGAPLINQRTGAVCGIINLTRDEGQALGGYAVPTGTILSHFCNLRTLQREYHGQDRRWDLVAIAARGLIGSFQSYFDALRSFREQLPYSFSMNSELVPELSHIYIEQSAEERRSSQSISPDEADKVEDVTPEEADKLDAIRRHTQTAQDALERNVHLTFEGGPGVGKSSLVSYLTSERVKAWERHKDASLVPVPVFARELATKEGPWSSRLRQQIIEQLSTWLQKDLPSDFFEQPPAPGASWLVMVDGLDEVVGQEQRNSLVETIRHLAKEHSQDPPPIYRLMVTTRPLPAVEIFERNDCNNPTRGGYEVKCSSCCSAPAW